MQGYAIGKFDGFTEKAYRPWPDNVEFIFLKHKVAPILDLLYKRESDGAIVYLASKFIK